jgi:hypothetical protein
MAALFLPLAGLGETWLSTHRATQQGTEWDVPVRGYDPGDYLRGHYVQFTYEWPVEETKADDFSGNMGGDEVCIVGKAPVVTRLVDPPATRPTSGAPCANYVRSEFVSEFGRGPSSGRLYASEAEAMRLQEALADPKQQGIVRVRLRPDGHLMPLRITFRPKPAEPKAKASTPPAP